MTIGLGCHAHLVLGPDATFTTNTMNSVDETIRFGFSRIFAVVLWITKQSWRHARPHCEDDKSQQIAHGHGPSPSLVQHSLSCGSSSSMRCNGNVEQPDQEQDRARNMDEAVDAIDPVHRGRILQKELLDGRLPEDTHLLFKPNQLQRMSTSGMNGALNKSHGCEGSSKLIHPVDECPVPDFNQEWKLL